MSRPSPNRYNTVPSWNVNRNPNYTLTLMQHDSGYKNLVGSSVVHVPPFR